jgi:hypothetical protein
MFLNPSLLPPNAFNKKYEGIETQAFFKPIYM